MKDTQFTVVENKRIAHNTYLSVLEGDTSDITASGQFVNIKLDGLYLRRPISVCDVEGNKLTIIYHIELLYFLLLYFLFVFWLLLWDT